MTEVWITLAVILSIYGLFFYGAHRADKAVDAKARESLEKMKKPYAGGK
jgi:hypothetical protein